MSMDKLLKGKEKPKKVKVVNVGKKKAKKLPKKTGETQPSAAEMAKAEAMKKAMMADEQE